MVLAKWMSRRVLLPRKGGSVRFTLVWAVAGLLGGSITTIRCGWGSGCGAGGLWMLSLIRG